MKNTTTRNKIDSGKVTIQQIFKDFWFRIPEYQRSYVWQDENIIELLEDIFYAAEHNPLSEYFLGSLVLQKRLVKANENGSEITFNEYDLLDGQQRLTTILLILAVIRDISTNTGLINTCSSFIYQQEDEFRQIPERIRMVYKIRDKVEAFIQTHIKEADGTQLKSDLEQKAELKNISISNMAKGILCINEYLEKVSEQELERFAKHLFNNVIVIYVASEELEDAFRLFTILNSRGIPLTNADILKSLNLGLVSNERESVKIAEQWEDIESKLGNEDFNRLLSFIRTIYVKEKARENIVKEFEEKIYGTKPPLLKKGKETFEAIFEYAEIYNQIINLEDLPPTVSNQFKNLVIVMWYGLPSNDWIPPLLAYYKKFQHNHLLEFTTKLCNKFSADWIAQLGPSSRINNMSIILRAIEKSKSSKSLVENETIFTFNITTVKRNISEQIYRKRYGKFILLLLEYIMHDHSTVFPEFTKLSIEHILPQNPSPKSEWSKLFTQQEQEENIHKLGNLLLISRSKNSALSRKDFLDKKKTYFTGFVSVFPNSLRVMQYNEWTLPLLQQRQNDLIKKVTNQFNK